MVKIILRFFVGQYKKYRLSSICEEGGIFVVMNYSQFFHTSG